MGKSYSTPGPRSIYPEICDSRSLGRCGLLANVLWPRLIVQADDQGRLHGDARDLRLLCVPQLDVSDADAEAALLELASVKSVRMYSRSGEPYVQLLDWWQYQSHMRRAYPSRFPPPPGWRDVVYGYDRYPNTYTEAIRGAAPRPNALRGNARRNAAMRGDAPPSLAKPSLAKPSPSDPVLSPPLDAAREIDGLSALKEALLGAGVDPKIVQ